MYAVMVKTFPVCWKLQGRQELKKKKSHAWVNVSCVDTESLMGSTLTGFTGPKIQSEAWLQSALVWWGQTVSGHSKTHTAVQILFGPFTAWETGWGFTQATPADPNRVTVTFQWSPLVQWWRVWVWEKTHPHLVWFALTKLGPHWTHSW